jgi:hypothetical protein
VAVAALALLAPGSAQAAFTMSVSGTTVTITGDATSQSLTLTEVSSGPFAGQLSHNQVGSGFAHDRDFDSDPGPAISTIAADGATVSLDGGGGTDTFSWNDLLQSGTGFGYALTEATLVRDSTVVDYASIESISVDASQGGDIFSLASTAAVTSLVGIAGNGGNDAIRIGFGFSTSLEAVRSDISVFAGSGPGGDDGVDSLEIGDGPTERSFTVTEPNVRRLGSHGVLPTIDIFYDTGIESRRVSTGGGIDRLDVSGAVTRTGLDGGGGDDQFVIWDGASLAGGAVNGAGDRDTLDYSLWTTAVAVDLGAGTATGLPGGHTGFERAYGGGGADTLTGRDGTASTLNGYDGGDTLRGGSAGDFLYGDGGGDSVDGGGGGDRIYGGPDGDTVTGGAGADELYGEGGDDELRTIDGEVDSSSCGEGDDDYRADTADTVAADCEHDLGPLPPPCRECVPPPGGEPPPGGTPPSGEPSTGERGTVALVLSSVSLTNRVFRVGTPTAAARRRSAPRGTHFRFTLSEAATVTIAIDRRALGRRVRGRCRRATRRNRAAPRCVRFVRLGALSGAGSQGANSLPFSGRLPGRTLAPGRYRARMVAVDSAGGRSLERRVSFRVVKG